jgi:hypothetical protein
MAVSQTKVTDTTSPKSATWVLVPGMLALILAAPVAILIHSVNGTLPDQPEKAVTVAGVLIGILLSLPPVVYLLVRRQSANPARLGLILLASIGVLLTAIYLYWVSFYILFPADILIWSESDFVNDILKFRVGYPLYTAQENNESFTYTPGTQILTFFLAWLLGNATSIPIYRLIQVGYTLLAAVVATMCSYKLVEISLSGQQLRDRRLWGMVWLPLLFLMASNSLTNPFVHNLHNDALAQLISVIAYWLLLRYVSTRDRRVLAVMAIVPALGFLVKQSLMIWAGFYCIQLAVFDEPRSLRRLVIFALAAIGGIGVTVAAGYLLWGDNFLYWTFTVLGTHRVLPLRSFQHALDVWAYIAIGLLGGLVLVRGKKFRLLLGPWLIWLSLISLETYTSGIAWMLNHIGPGCLIAGIWFLAALTRLWPSVLKIANRKPGFQIWLQTGIGIGALSLLFGGLAIIRIPLNPIPEDAHRYVREIEKEFKGQSTENILLDMGTWTYVPDGVIMKDRVPSIGERGYSQTGDFSGILRRLEQRRYAKILVRNLHAPDFWYDYSGWSTSSGIRQALLENYYESGTIREVAIENPNQLPRYGFTEISILVPNSD